MPKASKLNYRLQESIPTAGNMPSIEDPSFWACVFTLQGTITTFVARDVTIVGLVALMWLRLYHTFPQIHLQVGPVEIAGGALGLMLVFRSNVGYDRWYDGRRLWGDITNGVRNLVQAGLTYGPQDPSWQDAWVRWCACYPHVCRESLRNERELVDVARLVGEKSAGEVRGAIHMPSYVSQRLAHLLGEYARSSTSVPGFLVNMEAARQRLVDAVGGCERIASTPLPRVYLFKFRRFIAMYLLLLPAALVDRVGWVTPILAMLVAYPVLGMDRIAGELQAPFNVKRLSHLPLDGMCVAIERNAMAMLARVQSMGLFVRQ